MEILTDISGLMVFCFVRERLIEVVISRKGVILVSGLGNGFCMLRNKVPGYILVNAASRGAVGCTRSINRL